jgi:hypothetical protein
MKVSTYLIMLLFLVTGCGKDLEQQNAKLNSEKIVLTEKVTSLESKISLRTDSNQKLESEKNKLVEANKTLSSKLASSDVEKNKLEDDLKELEDKLKDTVIELAKFQGRWEAIEQQKLNDAKEKANMSELVLQLGVTMQSGETKPVSATTVYLTKDTIPNIVSERSFNFTLGTYSFSARAEDTWSAGKGSMSSTMGSKSQLITRKIESAALFSASTNFNGMVTFKDVPKGDYYILAATALGGGYGVTWSKPVKLQSGENNITLTQKDALPNNID